MNYKHQLEKVIAYISDRLDEKLTLTELSEVACFSKYHFHRLFSAYTGLSLQQYIRWLRLRRAAHQLIIHTDKSILNIAIEAGFESHIAFSRVFKQTCGMSPSEFRRQARWHFWENPPYLLRKPRKLTMNVIIKDCPEKRLAVIEHHGDANLIPESVKKLTQWIKSHPGHLTLKGGETFAFAYNDPKTTAPEAFRFDIGIAVPENLKLNGDVVEKRIPAGRYAITMHQGSHNTIGDTVYALYRDWLPISGETLGDQPCVFCYHNFEHEVAETALLTECWLLLN